jgi:hypothetical protein
VKDVVLRLEVLALFARAAIKLLKLFLIAFERLLARVLGVL